MTSGLSARLLRLRIGSRPLSFLPYALWSLAIVALLVTVIPIVYPGTAAWTLSTMELIPIYVVGATFISYALLLFFACADGRGLNLYMALLVGFICYALGAGVLLLMPDLVFSRRVLLGSIGVAILLALYPLVLPRYLVMFSLPLLLLLVVAVNGWALQRLAIEGVSKTQERIISSRYVLDQETQQVLPQQPGAEGGALAAYGDEFIVATANGLFYRLSWTGEGNRLQAEALNLPSPLLGRDTFYEQKSAGLQFRITDILVEYRDDGDALLVSHQVWDREDDCFRMAVSRAALNQSDEEASPGWERLYTTRSCIELPFDTVETGGRLSWLDDRVLFTVGDHGIDGYRGGGLMLAQDPLSDYGKVLLLDMQGGAEVFTLGHRNPQGLLVDSEDGIWVTEHGPAGGDEINRLLAGRNYGWPLVTYGVEYNKRTWPLNPDGLDHEGFIEPVHAFVPSVAISNLIQVSDKQFPRWAGDFLIGSLRTESLYRAHIREGRVIYVEPLFVGKRVRDIVEAEDGRVLLWSDDETVTVLSRRPDPEAGEDTFEQCRVCHERMGRERALAPNLAGIIGSKIASRRNFDYSPALKAVKGRWTEQRLLEFLQDPQHFAPGTSMGANGVSDVAERVAVVEFLKTYGKEP